MITKSTVSNTFLAVAMFAGLNTTAASAGNSPLGVWMNDTGRGAVEITQCGSKLCGKVVWTKSAKDRKSGCGKEIMGNVRKVSSKTWDGGWIYSPERKRRYDVELTPLSGDRLRVKGYAGSKFFSKTMIWTRAPADLERCDAPAGGIIEASTQKPSGSRIEPITTGSNKSKPVADEPANEPIEEEVASNDDSYEGDNGSKGGLDLGGVNLDGLKNVFKRTENGDCKVNTPWVKLNFRCDG